MSTAVSHRRETRALPVGDRRGAPATSRLSGLLGAVTDGQPDDEVESGRHGDNHGQQNRQFGGIDPQHEINVATAPRAASARDAALPASSPA